MELFIISGMLVISFGVAIERTKFKAMLDARDARIESLFCELNAAENKALEGSKNLERLQADLTRLDLQLENSLLLTHVEDSLMLNEKLRFKSLLESLEIEFDTLRIHWQGDAEIFGDQRAVRSILRNSFENSLRHGQAKNIIVRFQPAQQKMSKSGQLSGSYAPVDNLVEIWIEDDGIGLPVHDGRSWKELGKEILPVKQNQSNGIGLYLSRKLMERMQGQIFFSGIESEAPHGSEGEIKDIKSQVGFRTRLQFRGRIL